MRTRDIIHLEKWRKGLVSGTAVRIKVEDYHKVMKRDDSFSIVWSSEPRYRGLKPEVQTFLNGRLCRVCDYYGSCTIDFAFDADALQFKLQFL